jgi:hypothetical protein
MVRDGLPTVLPEYLLMLKLMLVGWPLMILCQKTTVCKGLADTVQPSVTEFP